MATINYFNNYTKFSQGIFRLRKLNKGHHIHFCMSKEIKNIISKDEINSIDILTFLLENEIKTLDSDYIIMLEQHLFNMIRKNENKESFIINNFYNQYLNKEDLLDTNKPKLTFTNTNLCENRYKIELSKELQENYNNICEHMKKLISINENNTNLQIQEQRQNNNSNNSNNSNSNNSNSSKLI